jgi:hypothetical protein
MLLIHLIGVIQSMHLHFEALPKMTIQIQLAIDVNPREHLFINEH